VGENEMKMGGKGGKGKRRQKNNSVSSPTGIVKEGNYLELEFAWCQGSPVVYN